MTPGRLWLLAILVPALAAAGCPGDGSRIPDEMMDGGGIRPTLPSIQANVFGVICVECHVPGGIAPFSLESEEVSFRNLVGVESIELQMLRRVDPGDPDNSYIVWKIEGRAGIAGTRMPPPPRSMLEPEAIAAIVEWIDAGAPR